MHPTKVFQGSVKISSTLDTITSWYGVSITFDNESVVGLLMKYSSLTLQYQAYDFYEWIKGAHQTNFLTADEPFWKRLID